MRDYLLFLGLLALLIFGASDVFAGGKWTRTNTALELSYIAVALADAASTADIRNHSDIVEAQPIARAIMGANPEPAAVAGYFTGAIVGHYLISRALPAKYRHFWQAGTVAVQAAFVANNAALGLSFSF